MNRTLRALALASLTFSVALALYSLLSFTSYGQVFAVSAQVLRTTGTALGLATAVVATVASAQARRWWFVSVFLWLAVLTPYSPYLFYWASTTIPAFQPTSEIAGLRAFLLSYAVPPVVTALVILARDSFERLSHSPTGVVGDEADGLEFTPLQG
jgi:hypothetical protein